MLFNHRILLYGCIQAKTNKGVRYGKHAYKKGNRSYHYWMTTWRGGGKMWNVHLGNCGKMDEETAKQKARSMKAAVLAIKIKIARITS
jgi:hypothetical protein